MSDKEIGALQAQMTLVLEAQHAMTDSMVALAADVTAIKLEIAQARGGWKTLFVIGAVIGALVGAVASIVALVRGH